MAMATAASVVAAAGYSGTGGGLSAERTAHQQTAISRPQQTASAKSHQFNAAQQPPPNFLPGIVALPGFGKKVTPGEETLLERSAVKVVVKAGSWQQVCSGNKVELDGKTYVSTAAHCASPEPDGAHKVAVNALPTSRYQFAIDSAETSPSGLPSQTPLAFVTKFAVDPALTDQALLSVSTAGDVQRSAGQPIFDALPALSSFDFAQPQVGQEVTLAGYPHSNDFRPTVEHGVYLGRLLIAHWSQTPLDVVATESNSYASETCNPGASGSTFALANGQASGEMFVGINLTGETPTGKDMFGPSVGQEVERALGIELAPNAFQRLCFFSAPQPGNYDTLLAATR